MQFTKIIIILKHLTYFQKHYLDIIFQTANKEFILQIIFHNYLYQFINDTFDLSTMISGKQKSAPENQQVCKVCKESTLEIRIRLKILLKRILSVQSQQGIKLLKGHMKQQLKPFAMLMNMIFVQESDKSTPTIRKCAHKQALVKFCTYTSFAEKQVQNRSKLLMIELLSKEYQRKLVVGTIRKAVHQVFQIAVQDQTRVYIEKSKAVQSQQCLEKKKQIDEQFKQQNERRKRKKMKYLDQIDQEHIQQECFQQEQIEPKKIEQEQFIQQSYNQRHFQLNYMLKMQAQQ